MFLSLITLPFVICKIKVTINNLVSSIHLVIYESTRIFVHHGRLQQSAF